MRITHIYILLFNIGLVLWVLGFIGEFNGFNIVRHGVLVGPMIFLVATAIWIRQRIKKPILVSYQPKKNLSKFDAIFAFIFNNLFREAIGLLILISMLFHLGVIYYISNSSRYQEVKSIAINDYELKDIIGELTSMSYYIMSSNETDANHSIYLYGTKGKTKATIHLYANNPKAKVKQLEYEK